MEKEKNMIKIMVIYYLKENISMEKNGMVFIKNIIIMKI